MFNRLCLVDPRGNIGRVRERGVGITALDLHMRQHIAPRVDLWTIRLQRSMAINHRRQHLIVDDDRFDGQAGEGFALRHHASQHITNVMSHFALADHQRPVLLDQANRFVAGHIFGGEDPDHARHGGRCTGINF